MQDLEKFRKWLLRPGRDPGTVDLYLSCVRQALRHPGGFEGRMLDRSLAPKTRRYNLAALRTWAEFIGDEDLKGFLKELRLPSPVRKKPRPPLDRDDWRALIQEIKQTDDLSEPERAVLLLMATRGFRVSDVLRLTRVEVLQGLKSELLTYEAKGQRRLEFGVTSTYKAALQILAGFKDWDRVENLITHGTRKAARLLISRRLKQLAINVGIDPREIYTHRLRRSIASFFLDQVGGDITKLKAWMQWASIETASQYVDYKSREELDDIASRMFKEED